MLETTTQIGFQLESTTFTVFWVYITFRRILHLPISDMFWKSLKCCESRKPSKLFGDFSRSLLKGGQIFLRRESPIQAIRSIHLWWMNTFAISNTYSKFHCLAWAHGTSTCQTTFSRACRTILSHTSHFQQPHGTTRGRTKRQPLQPKHPNCAMILSLKALKAFNVTGNEDFIGPMVGWRAEMERHCFAVSYYFSFLGCWKSTPFPFLKAQQFGKEDLPTC